MYNKALRTMALQDVQERARHGDFNAKGELYRRKNAQQVDQKVPAENHRSARASDGTGTSDDTAREAQALLRHAANPQEASAHRVVICAHEPRRRDVPWASSPHEAHRRQIQGILTNPKN